MNVADDNTSGANTTCDATLCADDQYVSGNTSLNCPAGTTYEVGDDASCADTACDVT